MTTTVQGLMSLYRWLREMPGMAELIQDWVIADLGPDEILANIRSQPVYRERFRGMAKRAQAGLNPINEATYLNLEDTYTSQLRAAGVLDLLGNTRFRFAEWIGDDVSGAELSRRIDAGYAQIKDQGEFVEQAFETFYGNRPTKQGLLLYFLDPDTGLDQIEREVAASLIGGQAFRYGLNITRTRAEILASSGVSGALAAQGFADIAREEPLLRQLAEVHGFDPLSQADLEGFFFHEDPDISAARSKIFDTAITEFQEGGIGRVSREGGLQELLDFRRTV